MNTQKTVHQDTTLQGGPLPGYLPNAKGRLPACSCNRPSGIHGC